MTDIEKTISQHEHLRIELKAFLMKLNSLLKSKVEVYNSYSGSEEILVSVCPNGLAYQLSETGNKCLKDKKWDEIDYMRFRHSFRFKDGFTV